VPVDNDVLRAWLRESGDPAGEAWELVLARKPGLAAAYVRFARVGAENPALDAQTRALLAVGLEATVTNLGFGDVPRAVGVALDAGATPEAVLEILALASIIGMHTGTVGIPALVEALVARGEDPLAEPLDARRQELWNRYVAGKRYWETFTGEMDVFLRGLLALDPDWFEAYMELTLEPWTNGTLEPKVRELLYIAVDTVTTHLYRPGLDVHLKTALALGATKDEIMAVYELAAAYGLRTISAGVAALAEKGVS
jgi:alkylhydroperoxidase/carboxymuconolactone decarboxylase family protein YurZ